MKIYVVTQTEWYDATKSVVGVASSLELGKEVAQGQHTIYNHDELLEWENEFRTERYHSISTKRTRRLQNDYNVEAYELDLVPKSVFTS